MHKNRDTMVTLLIENGADIDARGPKRETAAMACCIRGLFNALAALAHHNADLTIPNFADYTCAHSACGADASANVACLKLLISKGVDINALNALDQTPLDIATSFGSSSCIALLRRHNAVENLVADMVPNNIIEMHSHMKQMFREQRKKFSHSGNSCCVHADDSSPPQTPLQKCSGCKVEYYCSRECQKLAWKGHKQQCLQVGTASA